MENISIEIIIAIISPSVALISGLIMWYFNEKSKRAFQTYLEKLKLYENLIISVEGFYQGSKSIEKIQNFNRKMALAWMYCSSEVIEKADTFLETTRVGSGATDEQRDEALDCLMGAIRKDMKLALPPIKFKTWIASK